MSEREPMTQQKWAALPVVKRRDEVSNMLEFIAPTVQNFMPPGRTVQRMQFAIMNSIQKTPALLNCTFKSILLSTVNAFELGLEPDTALQECHLIPLKGEANLWLGYRGMLKLARSLKGISSIDAKVVYQSEIEAGRFEYHEGTSPKIIHVPFLTDKERGTDIALFYAVARFPEPERLPVIDVMLKEDVDKIRNASRGKDLIPWKNYYTEMGRKSVVRRVCKYLPSDDLLARAVEIDNENESGEAANISEAQKIAMSQLISDELPANATGKLEHDLARKNASHNSDDDDLPFPADEK